MTNNEENVAIISIVPINDFKSPIQILNWQFSRCCLCNRSNLKLFTIVDNKTIHSML